MAEVKYIGRDDTSKNQWSGFGRSGYNVPVNSSIALALESLPSWIAGVNIFDTTAAWNAPWANFNHPLTGANNGWTYNASASTSGISADITAVDDSPYTLTVGTCMDATRSYTMTFKSLDDATLYNSLAYSTVNGQHH